MVAVREEFESRLLHRRSERKSSPVFSWLQMTLVAITNESNELKTWLAVWLPLKMP
jgi:hypothetical protein